MKIKVNLSGSLRGIYADKGGEIFVDINEPVTIRYLLVETGINPLVVAAVLVDGNMKGKDFIIGKEVHEITLIGPIAGG